MKKLKINGQLLLGFLFIIIVAVCAFSIATLTTVTNNAETNIYRRLEDYARMVDKKPDNLHSPYSDMKIEYYICSDGKIYISRDMYRDINEEKINELIDKIKSVYNKTYPNGCSDTVSTHNHISFGNTKYYYSCICYSNMEEYTLAFTDSLYVSQMNRNLSTTFILVFALLILFCIYCVYIWSNRFTKRIRKLQNHILELPKNKYEVSYVDDSEDEIGDLSRSLDDMRQQVERNEKTKQEMLQNISHDFKTPIAVIKSYAEAQIDGMVDEESSKIIIAQADLLKKKVNTLLQYNSLEYLEKDRKFEDIDIVELVKEIVLTYKFRTDIEIELNLDNNITFKGYRENMYTVIDNILDNAKRYAKSKIIIATGYDYLRIYNDGEHIEEQFLNGLFKPYEKGAKGEFGLGMSIVKKTIDFFGLNLKVINEEPTGVSFVISNPKK